MSRKKFLISIGITAGLLLTAVYFIRLEIQDKPNPTQADPQSIAQPELASDPIQQAPDETGQDQIGSTSEHDKELTSCALTTSRDAPSVAPDQIYQAEIPMGEHPEWNIPFDIQPEQHFDLMLLGDNLDTNIAPCITKNRQVLCERVFISDVGGQSPWACIDVKLPDGTQKLIKVIARVKVTTGSVLPPELDKVANHEKLAVLGKINSAPEELSTLVPQKNTYGTIKFWASAASDSTPLGQVSAGFYFPIDRAQDSTFFYYDQRGDRYLVDGFTNAGKVWVSGLKGSKLEELLATPPGLCLVGYDYCSEPRLDSCRVIGNDPDNSKNGVESYFETLNYENVLRTQDNTWITLTSSRPNTSLPKLYITLETWDRIEKTNCD